jgi:hypothetical protein
VSAFVLPSSEPVGSVVVGAAVVVVGAAVVTVVDDEVAAVSACLPPGELHALRSASAMSSFLALLS